MTDRRRARANPRARLSSLAGSPRTTTPTHPHETQLFRITDNKGFAIKFENGWSVSVQWFSDSWESKTAEVALIHDRAWACPATGEIIPKGNAVEGYCTPERVADVIAMARALPAEFPDPVAGAAQMREWLAQHRHLDAYILPSPSGWHSLGARYGDEPHEYVCFTADRGTELDALLASSTPGTNPTDAKES